MTVVITGLCAAAGWAGARLALLAVAALAGQLSVGWANDAHDAGLDTRVGRNAKPVVRGDLDPTVLMRLAMLTLLACLPLSWLAGGWVAGSFHVVAVLSAWAYNLRLSRTAWSWLPYAVSFACLAPLATLGSSDPRPPELWLAMALALIGVGAHAANALPDVQDDVAAGVGGLAASVGARWTRIVAASSFLAASLLLAWSVRGWVGVAVLAIAVTMAVATFLVHDARLAFRLLMLAGIADLACIILSGVLA